jgi:hypothetical protein
MVRPETPGLAMPGAEGVAELVPVHRRWLALPVNELDAVEPGVEAAGDSRVRDEIGAVGVAVRAGELPGAPLTEPVPDPRDLLTDGGHDGGASGDSPVALVLALVVHQRPPAGRQQFQAVRLQGQGLADAQSFIAADILQGLEQHPEQADGRAGHADVLLPRIESQVADRFDTGGDRPDCLVPLPDEKAGSTLVGANLQQELKLQTRKRAQTGKIEARVLQPAQRGGQVAHRRLADLRPPHPVGVAELALAHREAALRKHARPRMRPLKQRRPRYHVGLHRHAGPERGAVVNAVFLAQQKRGPGVRTPVDGASQDWPAAADRRIRRIADPRRWSGRPA